MNSDSFEKMIKSLKSCRTQDQYIVFCDWVIELRKLYRLSGKQSSILNDEYLNAATRIGEGYEQIYYEDSNLFIDRKYSRKPVRNKEI